MQRLQLALQAFLEGVIDTAEIPEEDLFKRLTENGEIPKTPPPEVLRVGDQLHLSNPAHASIGYRTPGLEHWRLYTAPLPVQPLEIKSVRYGWRESDIVNFPN